MKAGLRSRRREKEANPEASRSMSDRGLWDKREQMKERKKERERETEREREREIERERRE